jgi:sulfur carrier protein ThiS
MTFTVTNNGERRELNFGCWSYVTIMQLVKILNYAQPDELAVTVNGKHIEQKDFSTVQVRSNDKVRIMSL